MTINLRRCIEFSSLFTLFFATHVSAQILQNDESYLLKAFHLTSTACAIYPAISDDNACMEKVLRKILVDRGIPTRQSEKVIREQYGSSHRLKSVIRIACEAPPRITDTYSCMDAVYHSILSSRDPHSQYFSRAEAEKQRKNMSGGRSPSAPHSGSNKSVVMPMVSTDILIAPNDPNAKYAYVQLALFGNDLRKKMVAAVKELQKEHPDIKGFIFDLRGNTGGWTVEAYEAVDALVDSPEPLISIRNKDGIHAYGTISSFKIREPQPGDITNGLPIGVLINGLSASASEFFAAALKRLNRSVIIGKRTWGKGTTQVYIDQADGSMIKMTVGEYLIGTPTNWIAVQCVGVPPDIEYEEKSTIKPQKEGHECGIKGAIVSGGRSSDPHSVEISLRERDPLRYAIGLEMTEVIRAFDNKKNIKK